MTGEARLWLGHLTRTALAHVAGWRVVEPID